MRPSTACRALFTGEHCAVVNPCSVHLCSSLVCEADSAQTGERRVSIEQSLNVLSLHTAASTVLRSALCVLMVNDEFEV